MSHPVYHPRSHRTAVAIPAPLLPSGAQMVSIGTLLAFVIDAVEFSSWDSEHNLTPSDSFIWFVAPDGALSAAYLSLQGHGTGSDSGVARDWLCDLFR